MTDIAKHVDQWLRDAHAMELQSERILGNQVKRIQHYPDLKARLEQHLSETRHQRERLENCMKRRGIDNSVIKDAAGRFGAVMQAMGSMLAEDEVVKGLMAGYTFEQMEIAAYRILVVAAGKDQDTETVRVCEQICAEEEAMAHWFENNLTGLTETFLVRDESGRR